MGTSLPPAGYVFGKGIYFSSEPNVAFAFALPSQGWCSSALGTRLRCILCCSIEQGAALGTHNNDLVRASLAALVEQRPCWLPVPFSPTRWHQSCPSVCRPLLQVPDKYILVERMDAVAIHFVLLYADEAPARVAAGPPPGERVAAPGAHGPAPQSQVVAQPQGRSPLLYLIVGYFAWLLYMSLREHWPLIRRTMRRKLGIRI
jgi:hypothetical protein